MNRRLIPSVLIASLIAAAAFAASAQTVATSVGVDATAQAPGGQRHQPRCPRSIRTRSRKSTATACATPARDRPPAAKDGKRCVAANGRVYSREDIDRTGEIDLADALRKLDPAIR